MNPRLEALHALQAVIHDGRSLTETLAQPVGAEAGDELPAFTRALAYGVLRYHGRLEKWLSTLMPRPLKARDRDIHVLLLLGLYQVAYGSKPQHVSVNETVALASLLGKEWARSLVNGVLRNFVRRRGELESLADASPETRHALPTWLWQALIQDYGDRADAIADALLTQAPMTLRINRRRISREQYLERLKEAGIAAVAHPGIEQAVTLQHPVDVKQLPGFEQGDCSVQDAAAQWCSSCLQLCPGQRVLDACAAPGGKTAACLEAEPGLAEVIALDADTGRQTRTRQTLERLGLTATVLSGDARQPDLWWSREPFDRILVDAPCSATGVIRRHPDIKVLRRRGDIDELARVQRSIIEALWPTLRPGGLLLYVTCSLLQTENDAVIDAVLKTLPDARIGDLPLPDGALRTQHGIQWLPRIDGHDGFYYALLTRIDRPTP